MDAQCLILTDPGLLVHYAAGWMFAPALSQVRRTSSLFSLGRRIPLNHLQPERLLEQLGTTPDEVAATLKRHGVQGVRNTVRTLNPIVRFVQNQIQVDPISADVMQGDKIRLIYGYGQKEEALLPAAVRQFMDAFNRGDYPELFLPEKASDRSVR